MSAAYKTKVRLDRRRRLSVSKQDLRAEYNDLLICLEPTALKLRSISLPLSRLLPIDADAIDLAERIEEFAKQVRESEMQVVNSKDKETEAVFRSRLERQLARDVIDILQADGLPVAASVSAAGTQSLLVAVLKALGDEVGLHVASNTWKNAAAAVVSARNAKRPY